MSAIRVALCQLDFVVGDIPGNVHKIAGAYRQAVSEGCDLAVFTELALTGYPPEDLVLKKSFVSNNLRALDSLASITTECHMLVGFVDRPAGNRKAGRNAAAMCAGGRVLGVYHKKLLPNYGVFDEERLFEHGDTPYTIYQVAGTPVGVSICEDMWFANGPVAVQARDGARLIVNINASPYSLGKLDQRIRVLGKRVKEITGVAGSGCTIVYVNQVGGQDELVFDGTSMVVDGRGAVVAMAAQCAEELLVVDLEVGSGVGSDDVSGVFTVTAHKHLPVIPVKDMDSTPDPSTLTLPSFPHATCRRMDEDEEIYSVLVLGTRDYLAKNGFSDAVIGLSGGIDSSLVAVIASDAIGPAHTHCIAMPSRYSSASSLEDAQRLAAGTGVDLSVVPIEDVHRVLSSDLKTVLGHEPSGLADENMQSRIRGIILMAISNARGWIVLTTGNKSELATGYSTLYGDTAGGFAVIKDVPKTMVYRLARYRNITAGRELIPSSVLTKPPSAELRPDQRDDQSLPPYEVLDPIMRGLVEDDLSIEELISRGYDRDTISAVARLVDLAEYKRRQSPPGVKITSKAFGKDRRVPITNHYEDSQIVLRPEDLT
ncbi:MAG: NAD+ synthase [Actinobacteria bacterium]|jgi:NAD+ synthase (glutamine-hydrolysing)|nr:NAD+ synthase [Actinomycetota bacterium]